MYNLNKIDKINEKFALTNSGDYLMDIFQVEEILTAAKTYLKSWSQDEIDEYNKKLLTTRENEDTDRTKEARERLKLRKAQREGNRFLYLIINKRNGLYKIGISISPIKRERTLQAEEPEIEILNIYKGGYSLEKKIHKYFENKRIRGEWFKLDNDDILTINDILTK